MYKLLTIFIGCLLLLSCREQQKASPFFEGYVEYDLKTEILDTLEETRQMAKFKGDKMICYFKDGYYIREYYVSNDLVSLKQLYTPIRKKFYHIFINGPVYESSAIEDTATFKNLEVSNGENKTILGHDCPSMISTWISFDKKDTSNGYGQLFFCQTLPLDSVPLKNITAGGYDVMICKYPNVAIGIVEEKENHYKETYTATKIVSKKLKGGFFSIPDGEIIKL